MSTEKDTPQEEKASSKMGGGKNFGNVERRNNVMAGQDFCAEVAKSFPFLHKDEPEKIPNTMHSACKTRCAKVDAASKLCPVLKFAAHAYSASLVQINLCDFIGIISHTREKLDDISFPRQGPNVIAGNLGLPLAIGEAIRAIDRLIEVCSIESNNGKYFHLLRINDRVKQLWDQNKKISDIRELLKEKNKWEDNCSVVLAAFALQAAFLDYRNSPQDGTSPQDRRLYDSFVQKVIRHFDEVLNALGEIRINIEREHEGGYVKTFSPDRIFTSIPGTIHADFGKGAFEIVKGTSMWDPPPAWE